MITALFLLLGTHGVGTLDDDLPSCMDSPAICAAAMSAAIEAASAAEPSGEPEDCTDPQAQQEMNRCAYQDFESADAALNEEWATTVAAMKAADAEIDRQYDQQPGHYETLLEGQRAWLKYRDAQCLMESFEARGGSMQPMLENFCKTYMTELRIQQLRLMTAGPE